MRPVAVLVLALCAGCPPASTTFTVPFTLLQANVGNTFLPCQDSYVFKLCQKSVEDSVKASIASLDPDVIAFQEILPDNWCDTFTETDPQFVCHPDNVGSDPSQIHRLLGDAYSYVCDDRHGYECVAWKTDGPLVGSGSYEVAPPVTKADGAACDDGFSVGLVHLLISAGKYPEFTLVNGHRYICSDSPDTISDRIADYRRASFGAVRRIA